MFAGFVQLESTLPGTLLVRDANETPINSDALPTFRVYGPNGFVESGTCSLLDSKTLTDASNASPIVITSSAHGFTTGLRVTVAGVTGNTAANGTFQATRLTADTYSLDGSIGNGAYASGGTAHATGLYRYSISCLGADGYESGEVYSVLFSYAVSSTQKTQLDDFLVD